MEIFVTLFCLKKKSISKQNKINLILKYIYFKHEGKFPTTPKKVQGETVCKSFFTLIAESRNRVLFYF